MPSGYQILYEVRDDGAIGTSCVIAYGILASDQGGQSMPFQYLGLVQSISAATPGSDAVCKLASTSLYEQIQRYWKLNMLRSFLAYETGPFGAPYWNRSYLEKMWNGYHLGAITDWQRYTAWRACLTTVLC